MKKKCLLIALLLGTALVLPGCGKDSEKPAVSLGEGYVAPYSVDESFFADQTEEEPEQSEEEQTEEYGISDDEKPEEKVAGNDSEKVEEKEKPDTEKNTGTDDDKSGKSVTLSGNEKTDYDVEVIKLTGVEDNISITYPVISGWDDEESQEYWNDVFFETVAAECRQAGSGDTISMESSVTNKSKKICSVVIKGEEHREGAAHPYGFCTTYNIDMESGKKLCLEDFADTKELAEMLLGEEGFQISADDVDMDDIFTYNFMHGKPSQKTLEQNLAGFDKTIEERMEIAEEMEMLGSSFLEDGVLNLVFEVNHAMGDYVWVAIE